MLQNKLSKSLILIASGSIGLLAASGVAIDNQTLIENNLTEQTIELASLPKSSEFSNSKKSNKQLQFSRNQDLKNQDNPILVSNLRYDSYSQSSNYSPVSYGVGYFYHTNLLPSGNYSYYEKALNKMVSYQRRGNEIVGGVYAHQSPNVVTCFAGIIQGDRVDVSWWNNLWQIGRSDNSFAKTYNIYAFTADNGTPQPYLDNPRAVSNCGGSVYY